MIMDVFWGIMLALAVIFIVLPLGLWGLGMLFFKAIGFKD